MVLKSHFLRNGLVLGLLLLIGFVVYLLLLSFFPSIQLDFSSPGKNTLRRLDPYTFESLAQKSFPANPIELVNILYEKPEFTAYLFRFRTAFGSLVTGQLNMPKGRGPFPVVVLLRGYVEKEHYRTGVGTRAAGEGFARHGLITLAPDFLGYGGSDPESTDVFEARFEKPVTVLSLISSINTLSLADTSRIGLWGHSNGGQIAFSVLEITKKSYPTSLWAPVSLGFPESVTNYFPELPDKGAYLQKQLDEEFLWRYTSQKYSITDHWQHIQAPMSIHQGGKDDLVVPAKTEQTVSLLKKQGLSVQYYFYPKENHLFSKGSAPEAVAKDIVFFRSQWEK